MQSGGLANALGGLLLAASLASVGCGDDASGGATLATPAPCNPLGGAGCVLPWPSSVYQRDAAASATGVRLDFPAGALPTNADGIALDPTQFADRDGFSPATYMVTAFAGGVDGQNLIGFDDYPASVSDASPTVIVDVQTGERVHHFAELDANAADDADNQALYLRPARRLRPGAHYAVGIRTSLRGRSGGPLPVPEGFAAIRDGVATSHAGLERARPGVEAALAALETAGVPGADLVVAWDFTTATDEHMTSHLRGATEVSLAAMGERGANLTFAIEDDAPVGDGAQIARKVVGTYDAPLVLTDGGSNAGRLARDAAGEPMVVGTYESPFVAMVPACAAAQAPIPIIIFGHGFFGDIKEASGRYMRQISQDLCMVVLGTEWRGMAERDIAGAALALNEGSLLTGFGERVIQGIVNYMALVQLARGAMASDLLVDGTGTSLVDPDRMFFYGISQGHVLGATLLAYEPVIQRAVLAVGGGNWSVLFERSTQWPPYQTIIEGAYPGPLNTVIIEALLQLAYDATENIHVVHTLDKQVLIHTAVGDSQVTNLATAQQVREMGLPLLEPSVAQPFGVQTAQGPLPSAWVLYDQKPEPAPPTTNERHDLDNDTHGDLRFEPAVIRQIDTFWRTGEVVHTCEGVCDCSIGACE